jgi:hypothetical protein
MFKKQLPSRVVEVIREYVSRADRNRPISVARLARAARAVMPDVAVGERELTELITRELVMAGANVDFDARAAAAILKPEVRSSTTAGKSLIVRDVMQLDMRWKRRGRAALRRGRK